MTSPTRSERLSGARDRAYELFRSWGSNCGPATVFSPEDAANFLACLAEAFRREAAAAAVHELEDEDLLELLRAWLEATDPAGDLARPIVLQGVRWEAGAVVRFLRWAFGRAEVRHLDVREPRGELQDLANELGRERERREELEALLDRVKVVLRETGTYHETVAALEEQGAEIAWHAGGEGVIGEKDELLTRPGIELLAHLAEIATERYGLGVTKDARAKGWAVKAFESRRGLAPDRRLVVTIREELVDGHHLAGESSIETREEGGAS